MLCLPFITFLRINNWESLIGVRALVLGEGECCRLRSLALRERCGVECGDSGGGLAATGRDAGAPYIRKGARTCV